MSWARWTLLLCMTWAGVSAAQGRSLTGTVLEATEQAPLGLVDVVVKGSDTLKTISRDDGSFRLEGVPDGEVTLQVKLEGFKGMEVKVPAGQPSVRILLRLDYLGEEEVVVVGRATESDRRHVANSVEVVSAEQVNRVPVQSVDQALQGKVAGANLQANSGAPGGGMQVRVRSISSINGGIEPLYVVDGVLVSNRSISSGVWAVTGSRVGSGPQPSQDDPVNRIADINPNDIESITVLKGASAAAIYGSKAANGVIIINTKRGRQGEPRLTLTQRLGLFTPLRTLGSRQFETEEEVVATYGESARRYFQPGITYENEAALVGRRDPSSETVISLSGSQDGLRYYSSALAKTDNGIIANTGYEKQAFRLNLSKQLGEALELQLNTNLIHSTARRGLTNNDNRGNSFYVVLASTPSFFDLRQQPDGTFPDNPFISSRANPLQTATLMKNNEEVWRLLGSADMSLKLLRTQEQELKLVASLGLDRFQQTNDLLFPPELAFEPVDDGLPGTSLFSTAQNLNLNLSANMVHSYRPTSGALSATTSFGFQHEQRGLDTVYLVSRNLNGGQSNVDAGTQLSATQARELVVDRGMYLQEELLLLQERLSVTGALRAEQSSANGNPHQLFFYPKAAVAYRFLKAQPWLQELKVRGAYGETGNQPLYGQRFTPLTVNNNIDGHPGLVVAGLSGSSNIRPERQRELELGVDAYLFNGGLRLDLTVYRRWISDLLLQRSIAPSTGFNTQFFNGGEMYTQGIELAAQATPVLTTNFQWLARTTLSRNMSQVTRLPVPAFFTGGFGTSLGMFRIEEGASATQIVGNDGLREDGTCCAIRKLGDTEPLLRMSLTNEFTYKQLRLQFLVDWQHGSNVINLTRFLYDLGQTSPDFASAGVQRLQQLSTSARPYIEDASFLKLREVSLSYEVPREVVSSLWGAIRALRVSASGRNLLVLSPYSGLDPEVSNFGNQSTFRNIDVAPFPPSRSVWASVEMEF